MLLWMQKIAKAKKTEATAALRRVQELVTEFGLTSQQVFPLLPAKSKKQGAAKYQNQLLAPHGQDGASLLRGSSAKIATPFSSLNLPQHEGPFLAEMAAAADRRRA